MHFSVYLKPEPYDLTVYVPFTLARRTLWRQLPVRIQPKKPSLYRLPPSGSFPLRIFMRAVYRETKIRTQREYVS